VLSDLVGSTEVFHILIMLRSKAIIKIEDIIARPRRCNGSPERYFVSGAGAISVVSSTVACGGSPSTTFGSFALSFFSLLGLWQIVSVKV
jgi:hypothetical protein